MIKSTCECYYDAALHKQSTNCPLHDPYRRCENLEAHIDQLESEITELRKDRERLAQLTLLLDATLADIEKSSGESRHDREMRDYYEGAHAYLSKLRDAAIAAAESKGTPNVR